MRAGAVQLGSKMLAFASATEYVVPAAGTADRSETKSSACAFVQGQVISVLINSKPDLG